MASKSSIAVRRDAAIEKSRNAIRSLWGDDFDIPRRHRDMAMLSAIQLESIAEYLECKAAEANVKVITEPKQPEFVPVVSTKVKHK